MLGKKGKNQYSNGLSMSIETRGKISKSSKGKKLSDETKNKLSIIRSEFMKANPEKCRRKVSWMEETFSKWLINKNIKFRSEVHFRNSELNKSYFVDFIFDELMLIIELDGNQHEKRKEHDKVRDDFFRSLGYNVIRISHCEFREKSKVGVLESLFASLV